MGEPRNILVTGAAGRIGKAACSELARRGHHVRGIDRIPPPGPADAVVGDLTDPHCVATAMAGMDAVIHLAATPDEDDFLTKLLPNNIIALYHVMEEARKAGVRQIILGSTGQVVSGHDGPWPVTPAMLTTPRNWYGSAKVFAEAIGQTYACVHGIHVIVVRLGWCPRDREHAAGLAQSEVGQDVYLSPGDAGRFFACAVERGWDIPFAIVFATSRPRKKTWYCIDDARRLLGYEPQHAYPDGLEVVFAENR